MSRHTRGLADPHTARTAWGRFRRMMRWMALAAAVAVAAAIVYLRPAEGPFPIHMLIATIAGVAATVLLATALMLLAFLSSGTGHDEDVARFEDER